MSKKTVSFSIAAYNIEKTIHECVDSILAADCADDIEILIIDDGSSDKTADIAREYESKYPGTVRLISKENGGHGSTINTGIKEARGEYFRAVDGDDWVNGKNIKEYIIRLKKEKADIVLCNYESYFEKGIVKKTIHSGLKDMEMLSFDEAAKKVDWMNYHSVTYKTDILKKNVISLDEHCFYVDTEFMSFPVPYADTVTYYDMDLYCYRRDNEGQSVCEESRKRNIDHSKKVFFRLLRFYKENEKELSSSKRRYLQRGIAGHSVWHFRGLTFFAPDKKRQKELIRFDRFIRKNLPSVFKLMTVAASNKSEGDVKIVRFIRKYDYKTYNMYGVYRLCKSKVRNLIKR